MEHKISQGQCFCLIICQCLGLGFTLVPPLAMELCGRDGLTAILLATLMAALYWYVVFRLAGRCRVSPGGAVVFVLRCGFVVKGLLIAGLFMAYSAQCVGKIAEGQAGPYIVMALMGLLLLYCLWGSRSISAALSQVIIVPLVMLLVFVLLSGVIGGSCSIGELLPLWRQRGMALIRGALALSLWFYPLEYVLINLPYIENRQKMPRTAALGVIASGLVLATVFALNIMRFGLEQMSLLGYYSVQEMMYGVTLPYSFIERQEGLMLGILTLGSFSCIAGSLQGASLCVQQLFKGFKEGGAALPCVITAYVIGTLALREGAKALITAVMGAEAVYFALIILLALYYAIRRDRNEGHNRGN